MDFSCISWLCMRCKCMIICPCEAVFFNWYKTVCARLCVCIEIWVQIFHFSSFMFSKIIYFMINLPPAHAMSIDKDWEDTKFGVDNGVDWYATVVHELKDYLRSKVFGLLSYKYWDVTQGYFNYSILFSFALKIC